MAKSPTLTIHPLTPERWRDFEALFGPHGAYGGCWCMWWRSTRKEFEQRQGEGNRKALKLLVDSGDVPGILAYRNREPVGWCSVAPREAFGALERSRLLRRTDLRPTWAIVCFYVAKGFRGQGIARSLVRAAVRHAATHGARIVEAFPSEPRGRELPPVSSYMGTPALFAEAGFAEIARPSKSRVVMRYEVS